MCDLILKCRVSLPILNIYINTKKKKKLKKFEHLNSTMA